MKDIFLGVGQRRSTANVTVDDVVQEFMVLHMPPVTEAGRDL
jgi:hypothetical protein